MTNTNVGNTYKNDEKMELMTALNDKKLNQWIEKQANKRINNDPQFRDELLKQAIFSGKKKKLEILYEVFGKAALSDNSGECQITDEADITAKGIDMFTKSFISLNKDKDEMAAVVYAVHSGNEDMIKEMVVMHSTLAGNKIPYDKVIKKAEDYLKVDNNAKNIDSEINETLVRAFRFPGSGLTPDDRKKSITASLNEFAVKDKLNEVLSSDNYSLIENAVRDDDKSSKGFTARIASNIGVGKKDKSVSDEWAVALDIAEIDFDKLKTKIKIPDSVAGAHLRYLSTRVI